MRLCNRTRGYKIYKSVDLFRLDEDLRLHVGDSARLNFPLYLLYVFQLIRIPRLAETCQENKAWMKIKEKSLIHVIAKFEI